MVVQPNTQAKKAIDGDKGKGCFIPKDGDPYTTTINSNATNTNSGEVTMAQDIEELNDAIASKRLMESKAPAERKQDNQLSSGTQQNAGQAQTINQQNGVAGNQTGQSVAGQVAGTNRSPSPQINTQAMSLANAIKDGKKVSAKKPGNAEDKEFRDVTKLSKAEQDFRNVVLAKMLEDWESGYAKTNKTGEKHGGQGKTSVMAFAVLKEIRDKLKAIPNGLDDPRHQRILQIIDNLDIDNAQKEDSLKKEDNKGTSPVKVAMNEINKVHHFILEREMDEQLKEIFDAWDHSGMETSNKNLKILVLGNCLKDAADSGKSLGENKPAADKRAKSPYTLVRGQNLDKVQKLIKRHVRMVKLFNDYFGGGSKKDTSKANTEFFAILRAEEQAKAQAEKKGIPIKTAAILETIKGKQSKVKELAEIIEGIANELAEKAPEKKNSKEAQEALSYAVIAKEAAVAADACLKRAETAYENARMNKLYSDYLGAVEEAEKVSKEETPLEDQQKIIEKAFAELSSNNKTSSIGIIHLLRLSSANSIEEIDRLHTEIKKISESFVNQDVVRAQASGLASLLKEKDEDNMVKTAHEYYDGEYGIKNNINEILSAQDNQVIRDRIERYVQGSESAPELADHCAELLRMKKILSEVHGRAKQYETEAARLLSQSTGQSKTVNSVPVNNSQVVGQGNSPENVTSGIKKAQTGHTGTGSGNNGPAVIFTIAGNNANNSTNSANSANSANNDPQAQARLLAEAQMRHLQMARAQRTKAIIAGRSSTVSKK